MKKSRLSLDDKFCKINEEIEWSNYRKELLKTEIQRQISRQSYQLHKENRQRKIRMTLAGVCLCLISFLVLAPYLNAEFPIQTSQEISDKALEEVVTSYRNHISAFNKGDYDTYLETLGKKSSITLTEEESLNMTAPQKGPIVIEKLTPLYSDHKTVILYSVEDVAVEAEKTYKRYLYIKYHKEESKWIINEKNIFKQYKYNEGTKTLQYDLSKEVKQSLKDEYGIDLKVE
ncbi:hypothetical protein [Metabacillus schmidteae]|uniref:hypothetical protein n=1 Tax=Metabacillus schmidteae TaxID=2730405 RepID=UPI0015885F13|nr:hypothetical protein [Metabacillus schmidteae]